MLRSKYSVDRNIIITIIVFSLILCSCSKEEDNPVVETDPCELKLVSSFSYDISEDLKVSTDIGLWMFCEQELTGSAIADWNGVPLDRKRLLEPINVIWLDLSASDANEAQTNVWDYLTECGFHQEHAYHSGPYHARYKTLWLSQDLIPPTTAACNRLGNKAAWTDVLFPFANNHGRIFPSYPLDEGFITVGAFSREGNATSGHEFISFDVARDQLDHNVNGWSRGDRKIVDIGNRYPPQLDCDFTTSNTHSGARVFIKLEPCSGFPPPAGEIWTYRIVGTSLSFSTMLEEVSELVGGQTVYRLRRSDNPPGLGEYVGCDEERGEVSVATDWWDLNNPSINGRHFWEPPLFHCQFGDPVGISCEWLGTFGGNSQRVLTEVITYESVTVPYGSFQNTMKIKITEYDSDGEIIDEPLYFWFDRNIGLVKGEEVNSGGVIELIAYSPSPLGRVAYKIRNYSILYVPMTWKNLIKK